MSDRELRQKLIRLAHKKPELRSDLLPILEETGTPKKAVMDGYEVMYELMRSSNRYSGWTRLLGRISREDPDLANLMQKVWGKLEDEMTPKNHGVADSLQRFLDMCARGGNWDIETIRTSVQVQADQLGVR